MADQYRTNAALGLQKVYDANQKELGIYLPEQEKTDLPDADTLKALRQKFLYTNNDLKVAKVLTTEMKPGISPVVVEYGDVEGKKCKRCEEDVNADQMQKMFPNANPIRREAVRTAFNENKKKYDINTCTRKAHFWAQVSAEVDMADWDWEESMNRTAAALLDWSNFNKDDKGKAMANKLGRATKNSPAVSPENQIKIANYAYGWGNLGVELGNIPPMSKNLPYESITSPVGWKYRGRGLLQTTGLSEYKAVTDYYKVGHPSVDFVANPELMAQPEEAVLSAMILWMNRFGANQLADKGCTKEASFDITDKVNKLTPSRDKRRALLLGGDWQEIKWHHGSWSLVGLVQNNTISTKTIFKVDECMYVKIETSITACNGNSCVLAIADVVPTPRINDQGGENKNRFHSAPRHRNKNGHSSTYYHGATDILCQVGTELYSLSCGEVIHIRTDLPQNDRVKGYESASSYGNTVTIKSTITGFGILYIFYAHLSQVSVQTGQKIKHGDSIGKSGSTGNAMHVDTEYRHVHIEVGSQYNIYDERKKCMIIKSTRIDPEKFMKTKFDDKGKVIN